MFSVELSKKAAKFLKSRTPKDRSRLLSAIKLLAKDPHTHELDIKKLKSEDIIYRLRVGSYRILYTIFEEEIVILVLDIGNRGDIYK